jgi:mono/diheme cytochrome c family protein
MDVGQEMTTNIFPRHCPGCVSCCHSGNAKGAPSLKGLLTHPTMVSGEPMSEEAVKNQFRNGSANMAAYKYALNDADVNDLRAYLKEKGCWDSDSPPPNPRYIAK